MSTLRLAELCAGYGGLGLALNLMGLDVGLAWYADNAPDASAVMAAHHPGVTNLGDITGADWSRAEPVDIIAAGYPCQSFSHAGLRKGFEDERAVWPYVADAVRHLRPRLVLLENVSGHVVRGFPRVLGDLAALGYDTQWMCLRASDLGAPHQRDRLFVYAFPAGDGVYAFPAGDAFPAGGDPRGDSSDSRVALLPTPRATDGTKGGPNQRGSSGDLMLPSAVQALLPTPTAADGSGGPGHGGSMEGSDSLRTVVPSLLPTPTPTQRDATRRRGWTDEEGRPLSETVMRLLPTPTATDGQGGLRAVPERRTHDGPGHGPRLRDVGAQLLPTPTVQNWHGNHVNNRGDVLLPGAVIHADRWGRYGAAIRRWESVCGQPAPEPTEPGRTGAPRLSPAFVEWMMGLPAGYVTGLLPRNAALRVLGNGVVPVQAAAAFCALAAVKP